MSSLLRRMDFVGVADLGEGDNGAVIIRSASMPGPSGMRKASLI